MQVIFIGGCSVEEAQVPVTMSNTENHEQTGELETDVSRDPRATHRLDTVTDLLQTARRRYVLYYLFRTERAVLSVEELVGAVREYEDAGTDSDETPSRQAIRTDLVHAHLPRLSSAGVVDYDPRSGNVQFHGYPPLEEWVERARRLELS